MKRKIAINWFASTGAFHRNGRTLVWRSQVPDQNDDKCAKIARRHAEQFAARCGQKLKDFSVQLIGRA